MREFFYYPMKPFGVRALSRELHLSTRTILKYLKHLRKDGLVLKVKARNRFPHYEANRLSRKFKLTKSSALMGDIAASGLIDYLESELAPKAIVIFGSAQKGTYLKHSDIDIFIQGNEEKLDLALFEKRLGHEVQMLYETDLQKLTEGLRNNIINGTTVSGALEL